MAMDCPTPTNKSAAPIHSAPTPMATEWIGAADLFVGVGQSNEQIRGTDPFRTDTDGDGLSDLEEVLAGTNPTNSASAFRITAVTREGNNLRVTWMTGPGKTNALQRTLGGPGGSYRTNTFVTIFTVTNTVGTATNRLDIGAATNSPAIYYRVRLVP